MLLREFLDDSDGPKQQDGMLGALRQQVMDYLTPLVAHEVDFVTVQDVEDTLRDFKTGLTIDRGLVMELLNPDTLKLVKKIEGDKVYLNVVAAMTSAKTADAKQHDAEKISDLAQQQAKKAIDK